MHTFTFMMCSERSGSNLLTRLMNAHPQVCGPAPIHLLRHLADHRHRFGDLSHDHHWQAFLDAAVALLDTRLSPWRTGWTAAELHAACPERSLPSLVRTVYEAEARAYDKPHLWVKTNHLHRYLPLVLTAFPEARVVHLVRDPRDQALSWKRSPQHRGDTVRAGRVWTEDQTRALHIHHQLAGTGRITWLRYEDLIDHPERVLPHICAHIGRTYTPAMLGFHQDASVQAHAAASSTWKNVGRPLMKGNHGKYRQALSDDEVRLIEWQCREPMASFGYTPDHAVASPTEGQALLDRLIPLERHVKAEYQQVPESERALRAQRAAVVRAIASRPSLPLP